RPSPKPESSCLAKRQESAALVYLFRCRTRFGRAESYSMAEGRRAVKFYLLHVFRRELRRPRGVCFGNVIRLQWCWAVSIDRPSAAAGFGSREAALPTAGDEAKRLRQIALCHHKHHPMRRQPCSSKSRNACLATVQPPPRRSST